MDRSNCQPVMPGGSCPECGWSNERPFIRGNDATPEPHPVLPYGGPKTVPVGKCANCGASWNLDEVKCANCQFVPASPQMWDVLRDQKNAIRRTQYLAPLPVRPQPITNTADVPHD